MPLSCLFFRKRTQMANQKEVLYLSVNDDKTCFACGTEFGFRAYSSDPLRQLVRHDIPDCGGIGQVYMLKMTNLVAIVGTGKHMKYPMNRVYIWDVSQKKAVLEFTFSSPILNVKMRKDMIIVVLRNKIYAYSFPNDPTLLFSHNTRENKKGICEISSALDNQWCIFPGPKVGSIQVLDIKQLGVSSTPSIINAHQHEIACLALNQHGTLIATASRKGTLIRVFELKTRRQTIELRRGADPAALYCINFSADSAYLCASSDKGTVHIFALKEPSKNKKSALSKVGLFGNYGESQWGIANFSVQAESPCLCVFGAGSRVIAVCFDGSFHKYVFTKDGNCNREEYDLFLDVGDNRDFT